MLHVKYPTSECRGAMISFRCATTCLINSEEGGEEVEYLPPSTVAVAVKEAISHLMDPQTIGIVHPLDYRSPTVY